MENDIVSIPRAQYQRWCKQLGNSQRSLPATSTMTTPSISSTATTTTSDLHNVSCLPPELLLEILGYLTGNQSTLYNVTLVCRQWFLCATPILYKHPKIYNTYRWAIFLLTLSREKRLFHYGSLIHSIDLSCRDQGKAALKLKCKDLSHGSRMTTENTVSSSSSEPSVTNTPTASNDNNSNNIIINNNTTTTTTTMFTTTTTITMNNDDDTDTDLDESDDDAITHWNNANNVENRQDELLELLSEDDELYMTYHPIPSLVVSTSSLIQLAKACPNLVAIDLSFTNMFSDSVVEETGDYISTLQHYAIPPGLTHVKVSIETAINAIGQQCPQLQQLKLQCCGWVCARVIWLWAMACPNLTYLDARRSSQCTVKRLTTNILRIQHHQPPLDPLGRQQNPASLSSTSSSSSAASSPSSPTTLVHLPRRSSSASSSASSSSASSSSYENLLASTVTDHTSARYWNTGEGSSTSNNNNNNNNNNHASASASSSSSSIQLSGSIQHHSAPLSSSTAAAAIEREATGTAQTDDQSQQHHDIHQHYPPQHPLFTRFRHRRRMPLNSLERFFMTIYMNDDDTAQMERILGRDDWWALHDDFLEQQHHHQYSNLPPPPPPPPTQINTPATAAATPPTTAANAPMLPPAPALNANHFTAASTIRSRAYRDFMLSTPSNQNNTVYITDQTLREYVWSVLKEGKEQGMVELEWVHD